MPQVLTSPVAPIVDDEVFPADKVVTDDAIIAAKSFAGQYTIESYAKNSTGLLQGLRRLQGHAWRAGQHRFGNIKYYANSNNLKLDVQQGNIDVAWRSLSPTDVEALGKDSKVKVHKGPGGELRYIVFNFDIMPFGAKTSDADPAKSLAVRQAAANLVDREAIANDVYKGTYLPVYSYVPQGFTGAIEPLKEMYGEERRPVAGQGQGRA